MHGSPVRGRQWRARWGAGLLAFLAVAGGGWLPGAAASSPAWTIVTTPNVGTGESNAMDGVSCPKAQTAFCMAVGGYYTGTSPVVKRTEIQKWNGSAWAVVASPNATAANALSDFLGGVSCPTVKFCMAAGYYTQSGGNPDQALIEKWNGASWSVVPAPDVAGSSNDLTSVSCVGTKFCVAAGYSYNSSFLEQTLVEKWNGTSWSIVTSADTSSSQDNFLWGVSCPSTAFCMADGYYDDASGNQLTLMEKWAAGVWAVTPSPTPTKVASPADDTMWSISCVTSKFCVAAGDYRTPSFVSQNLIERWSGTKWTIMKSPDTSTTLSNGLYTGVSCAATTFCAETTAAANSAGYNQALALMWSGTAWTIATTPDTSSTQNNQLQAATCPTTAFCLSVGQYQEVVSSTLVRQNLSERWQ